MIEVGRATRAARVTLEPATSDSLGGLLHRAAAERKSRTAIRHKTRGIWRDVTWHDLEADVADLALGFRAVGLRPGDTVGVASEPTPEWVVATLALAAAGMRVLSLYQALGMADLVELFGASDLAALVVDGADWPALLAERGGRLPRRVYVSTSEAAGLGDVDVRPLAEVRAAGADQRARRPDAWAELLAAAPAAESTLLFTTAGTSGPPKLVTHSEAGLLAAGRALATALAPPIGRRDRLVVELPTGHAGAFMVAIVLPLLTGAVAHLPEQLPGKAVAEVHPTVSLGLPLTWELHRARVRMTLLESRGLRRLVFEAGERARRKATSGWWARLAAAAVMATVFIPLLRRFGLEQLRAALIAGPIAPDVLEEWRTWGVPLQSLYGTAEAGPGVATVEGGTLRPLPGYALRCRRSVLQVRAPAVAGDEWLGTGDQCVEEGDRVELRAGLADVDAELRASPYIREAVTSADSRGDLHAVLEIDFESVANWARRNAVSYQTPVALRESERVRGLLADEVERAGERLAGRGLGKLSSFTIARDRLATGREISPNGLARRRGARARAGRAVGAG